MNPVRFGGTVITTTQAAEKLPGPKRTSVSRDTSYLVATTYNPAIPAEAEAEKQAAQILAADTFNRSIRLPDVPEAGNEKQIWSKIPGSVLDWALSVRHDSPLASI